MTLAPDFFVKFLARRRVQQLSRRLRDPKLDVVAQFSAYARLIAGLSRTEFGTQHGLKAGLHYDSFRTQVAPRPTREFRPLVERMAAGASDVLWPGRCRLFAYTSGTVDGTPHPLPVTGEMLAHYRTALQDAMLLHALRSDHMEIFLGRHLHVGASTALTSAGESSAGYLDAMAWIALSEWSQKNLYAPASDLARETEGPRKLASIADRYHGFRNIRAVAGAPAALLGLAHAMRTAAERRGQSAPANLHAAWPHLSAAVLTGALPTLLLDELRAAVGTGVLWHEIYAATEGIFAAQDGEFGEGLRLLSDSGIFFEFLPLRDITPGVPPSGAACVPLDEAQVNVDYALVVTTPAGLCRALTGDRVRFTSLTPPRLIVTGRLELQLNLVGEQVAERLLTEAVLHVCGQNRWQIVEFHVAPLRLRTVPRIQGCHEWWVELRSGTVRTPTGPLLAAEIDAELRRRHADYANRRASGALEAPVVRLVMPGTFEERMRLHQTPGGYAKISRCRNDRLIADQLSGITRFHSATQAPFR